MNSKVMIVDRIGYDKKCASYHIMNSYDYEKLVANSPHAMMKLVDKQHRIT